MDGLTSQKFCSRVRERQLNGKHAAWRSLNSGRPPSYAASFGHNQPRLFQAENLQLLLKYLRTHPCVDCGERDPVVLDFNHRDPSLKRMEVSLLVWRSTWVCVEAEIAKCDVRCANCHRRRTAVQRSWRKLASAIGM